MENRKEKLEELALYLTRLNRANTPNYFDVMKKALELYRELYLVPLFEAIGEKAPPLMYVEKGIGAHTAARYNATQRCVEINYRRIFSFCGNQKVNETFGAVIFLGHEYRHALQHIVACRVINKDDNFINKIEDKKLASAGKNFVNVMQGKAIYDSEEDVKLLFKFFPELYKDIEAMCDNDTSYEDIVKTTSNAIYYREEIEKDAREQSSVIFNQCIDEMGKLQLVKQDVLATMKKILDLELSTEKENYRQLLPIMKRVDGSLFKLGNAKFADFGMQLYKGKIKGLRAYQEGKGDSLLKTTEEKTKLLQDIIKFYVSKKVGQYDEEKRQQHLAQLRAMLVQNGLLLEKWFLSEVKLLNKITDYDDYYYQILKSDEVSKESFELVRGITDSKVNDLIIHYLQNGKMVFVEEMLKHLDMKQVRNFLLVSTNGYRRGIDRGNIIQNTQTQVMMEQNLLGELTNVYVSLMKKQKEGTLLFDEIDEFALVLKKFCEVVHIDLNANDIEGGSIEKEMKLWLVNLYSETEKLAMKQVELMMGYRPTADEFSLDNPEDREKFLLKGKNKELWIKKVYGYSEYKRVVTQREANEEYIAEN